MITEDLKSLGIVADKRTFTSDYFDQILELAEKLITEGKAYIDMTPAKQAGVSADVCNSDIGPAR